MRSCANSLEGVCAGIGGGVAASSVCVRAGVGDGNKQAICQAQRHVEGAVKILNLIQSDVLPEAGSCVHAGARADVADRVGEHVAKGQVGVPIGHVADAAIAKLRMSQEVTRAGEEVYALVGV